MLSTIKGRIIVILGLSALCVWALLPKEGPTGEQISPLNLGLDLQGGMHLAVEIDDPEGTLTQEARAEAIETTLTTIRNRIDEFGVREPTIQRVGDDRIIVELAGIDDPERAKSIVERTASMQFQVLKDAREFRRALPRMDRAIVDEIGAENLATPELDTAEEGAGLSEIIGEADTAGAVDDTAGAAGDAADTAGDGTVAGDEAAAGDTPGGEETPPREANLRPLSALLLESGGTGQFLVPEQDVPTVERYLELPGVQDAIPRNTDLRWDARARGEGGQSYRTLYVLNDEPLITGDYLADAGPASRDPMNNQPVVPFEMTRRGARIFERGTSRHVGEQMAIVLDGRVQSAPVIREVLSRRAQIELSGGGTLQEAQDLTLVLRAGALPQPIRIVEERTVGPSLGEDSIRQGTIAFAIGIVGVILMMIAYYRMAGFMAIVALGVYVLLLLGGLAGLGANLTLPGIAGIILSVGMAVDANVLIFERIREEVDVGKSPRTAVEGGFDHALSAIVDANLTTLITAVILYQFGTGPVKGFAVTLTIGIIASFFTALYVTRTLFLIYLERHAPTEPISI